MNIRAEPDESTRPSEPFEASEPRPEWLANCEEIAPLSIKEGRLIG